MVNVDGVTDEHLRGGSRRVAVVGGTGFLGAHIVRHFRTAGWTVDVYTAHRPIVESDGRLVPEAEACDVVIWAASRNTPATAAKDPSLVEQEISEVSAALGALKKQVPSAHFIFLSSGGTVYGGGAAEHREADPLAPTTAYGQLKARLERLVVETCAISTVLRVANAYGPGQGARNAQGVLGYWLTAIQVGDPITVYGNLQSARDYIYAADVASAVAAVADLRITKPSQRTYNVGSGVATSLQELLSVVQETTGYRGDVLYQPGRDFDLSSSRLDTALIKRELGWTAKTTLSEGVGQMWKWLCR